MAKFLKLGDEMNTKNTEAEKMKSFSLCSIIISCFLLSLLSLDFTIHYFRGREIEDLNQKLESIEIDLLEMKSSQRTKRQVEIVSNLNEDGVPIVSGSVLGQVDRNTEGLRIYEGFQNTQNPDHIPRDETLPWHLSKTVPIRPHHKLSAAWVDNESSSTMNRRMYPIIGDSMFPTGMSSATTQARSSYSRPTIHIPADNYYKNAGIESDSTAFSTKIVSQEGNFFNSRARTFAKDNKQTANINLARKAAKNRDGLRSRKTSFKTRRLSTNSTSIAHGNDFKSVHYVMDISNQLNRDSTNLNLGRMMNADGIFKNWQAARWVRRINRGSESNLFPMDRQGRMRVQESGVYFIYAQITYLDEHDVNAYHVIANNEAFLLCTVMTHTPRQTNKANTCYTSGVTFLEKGDDIFIRDLEPGRFSVFLPAHTFFGAIQLAAFS